MTIKRKIIKFLWWLQKYTNIDIMYVIKGSFWWMIGKAGIFLTSFVTMIFFGRWLPKEGYGTYQFIIAGLALFEIFTLPGINTALIKSITQKKEGTLCLALKTKIKWGKIGTFLCLGLSSWYFFQENSLLAIAFLLVALFLPFYTTFRIFIAFWSGRKRFDLQAKYNLLSSGLSTILLISTIYLTNNILIIISVFLSSHTFFDWLLYRKTKNQIKNDEKDENAIFFGKNLTIMSALQTVAQYIDKIIIWSFLGAIPVAIYTFAKEPIEKVKELIPIFPLALPKLGENKIDKKRKKRIILNFLQLFLITTPTAGLLTLMAPFIYKIFFPQYMESVVYFQALSIVVVFSPFLLLNASLIAEMKKKALYMINTGAPFLKIVLFFVLVPQLGIWGIIISIIIAEFIRGLITLYFFLKI